MVVFNRIDLEYVLTQILQAEAGQPPVNVHLAFGLREVLGTDNNAVPGQAFFGTADQLFPRVTDPLFQSADNGTSYAQVSGTVVDSDPRTISNLIADQTADNSAAVDAQATALDALGTGYQPAFNPATPPAVDAAGNLFIPNVTPDSGLSAPFNTWFTLFGQFFDHGLDLVSKGGSGFVFIPLAADDPLRVVGPDGIAGTGDEVTPDKAFMVLTRATNQPGPDGVLGTADDVHEATNTTTPFVDQNQTYSSTPSHQVFLREYAVGADGRLHSTGKLISHINADGSEHMATWAGLKANALKLGILLTDADVNDVPLLATDDFGNFIPGAHGFAQIVKRTAGADGILGNADDQPVLVEGNPASPVDTAGAFRTGHAFINDKAFTADPFDAQTGALLTPDADNVVGNQPAHGFYDNELLDAHYVAGDGRVNENIGLTAVHEVFHNEHNRLIEQTKDLVRGELAKGDTSFALNWVLPGVNLADGIQDNEWNGERLFQAAKFGTETQYQHLVFEEFARKVAPTIHLFGNTDIHLDPAITAEFAHTVYRFGHSMLDEPLNRVDANGNPIDVDPNTPGVQQLDLIDAFTNPLAYLQQGADAAAQLVRGTTGQVGNEIDEFVTGALRNNLLGLPLDLAALNLARGRDTGVPPINLVRNQIYSQTHDAELKPYESWFEFGSYLKHEASLVNFIAAYGTHSSIVNATTLVDKRAAALDLVVNGSLFVLDPADPTHSSYIRNANFSQDAFDFLHSRGAYANDLANPLAVHSEWSTGSITGLDNVDLWIGGLAEKQNLFGGLLGSTFNFIFENQLESLQDGDRLYYLPRIEGIHFGSEIEGNTFADLITHTTGAHHLSGAIFMTPEYVVEASTIDPNDPSTWTRNPETGKLLLDVMNDGTIRFLGDDNFLGNTMVLGGTEGDDRLQAGHADDDTVHGDGGNDVLDAGGGADNVFGGAGDDVITDIAGDDVIHGDAGNDTISSGIGDDTVFGGDGNDLIRGGAGIDDILGGLGNDIIFGGEDGDEIQGNEGDDWIDGGANGDVLVGDQGAPTGQVPLFAGNDVLDGGAEGDRMQGFSGDDIMLGQGGFDKFEGRLGFDWASFEKEDRGVSVDMTRREFVDKPEALGGDAIRDFFIETEAVSGSSFNDFLQGTNNAKVDTFNELVNVNLIFGLASFFPDGPVAFSDGNIMLGGDGSDIIEGRGGNDIIDGDAYLHVALTRNAQGEIFAGSQIIREILFDATPGDVDTAVFSDVRANYIVDLTPDAEGFVTVSHVVNGVAGVDGTDRLRNIERLQFTDTTIAIAGNNAVPTGTVNILGDTNPAVAGVDPLVGSPLTANAATLADADGIVGPIHFQWQYQEAATGNWVNIIGANSATFTPINFVNTLPLRVQASFVDGDGFTEIVYSTATNPVALPPDVQTAPFVVPQQALVGLPDTTAVENTAFTLFLPLTVTFSDLQTPANQLIFNATLADGTPLETVGLSFATIPDGAGGISGGVITGTPPANFHGTIDVRVSATDSPVTPGGSTFTVTDTFTINVVPTPGDTTAPTAAAEVVDPIHSGVAFDKTDLQFVLTQIRQAEAHQQPVNPHLAFGLREVAGTNNNALAGQSDFGSADQAFPRMTDPLFQTADNGTSYSQTSGFVFDSDPRTISNLIADQTANNPAALEAQAAALDKLGNGYQSPFNPATPPDVDAAGNLFIPNVTPDNGLSAPFNTWFTLFGQFFDHGLDLVTKGGSGTVFIPLQADDPLFNKGPDGLANTADDGPNFMVLTRATNLPGADGVLGTADDVHEGTNTTTPFVDQNQTYSSTPSHQVFLREYAVASDGKLHSTGKLLTHINADGSEHMATWADVKANALKLGIRLTDADVNDVPLLATDEFGNFIPGPHGFVQLINRTAGADGIIGTADDGAVRVEGNPAAPISTANAFRTGHAFINDKAFTADPFDAQTGALLAPDADSVAGGQPAHGFYDNELLDAHYVAGDGRVNENIGLTAVHEVFHNEHNRLIDQIKDTIRTELANGDTAFASDWVLPNVNLADGIQDNEWNGERLFQAAKLGTETQYQHLVFEEFARKVAPTIHLFGNTDIHLDPAITAEFAHAVYRFGHSMLDENVNRYVLHQGAAGDPLNGTPELDANGHPIMNDIGLIDAFTNPLAYLQQGANAAGEIVLGTTNQVGNEIDEFVTGALRNNLLGLPLDLAALNIARGRDTGVPPINLVRNQFYSETHDAELKPYESWDDFGQYLKHPASLINFVAAYGTHSSIVNATTLVDKRAAALDLVTTGSLFVLDPADPTHTKYIPNANFSQDAYDFLHSRGAYANDIANPLAVHSEWSTGSITGLDNVDLWIGGLAEKQNLFGGLLGSTFNFIFETQLESLQDGDRLYYLPRLEGTHFLNEIEGNTFAELIMNNTGTHHLGANIFMTPEYVVEASTIDPNDPATWTQNPVTGKLLVDVMNDGTIRFLGDDNFLGNTIVLGGTEGDDKLIAGNADDDTVWGDGGNDILDGGGGNDVIFGGTGNDTITDVAGDDIIHGDAGNDTISAGIGDDTVFGGDGNDLIEGGQGIDDILGGLGNDIIFGGEDADEIQGNEGDDWIDGGANGDVLVGDQGAPTGQVPLIAGNDVLDGGAEGDRMQGFSGDDIMLGQGGFDKFEGRLGFDWASFEKEDHGVSVDMTRREFIDQPQALGGDAIRDFFIETEAVSGSSFNDFLQGTIVSKIDPFNELDNVNLITGLDRYFPAGPVAFSGGNIMLGGGGSDFIEGRGGNDIIDGDAYLHVELTRDANGKVFAGSQIIREIRDGNTPPTFDQSGQVVTVGDIDTAVFSDVSTNYQISFAQDADGNIIFGSDGNPVLTVTHLVNGVIGPDGVDTVRNIERFQFADETIENMFAQVTDFVAQGALTIFDNGTPLAAATSPAVGEVLSAVSTINDFEGVLVNGVLDAATAGFARTDIPLNELHLQWQMQDIARPQWIDIVGATQETFAPTDFYVGHVLRVVATFLDGKGVTEQVFSAPTAALVTNPNINHAPTVVTQVAEPGLFDTSAEANQPIRLFLPLITTFTDDLTPASQLIYRATLADGRLLETVGLSFTVLTDATGVTGGLITGTPPANFTGPIDVLVSATDGGPGTPLTVTDTFTINVLPTNNAPVITSDGGGETAVVAVLENTTAVTTVTAIDPDAGTTFAFSITGGADASQLTINATTGELSFINAPNFEAPTDAGSNNVYDVIVQVSDGSLVDTQALAITVANQNEAPVITSNGGGITAAVSVVENTTAVTTVTATDQDVGTTLIYSIAGGADAGKFAIDATTGALSFKTAPVFGAPTDAGGNNVYDVIVRASDGSLNDMQAIAVTVNEANKAPTRIVLDPAIVAENQPGAIIGTLTVLDPNVGDAHSITLSDARFQVVGGQLKLVAGQSLNHEAETTVTITVTATDRGGLSKTSDVTIYVGDVADTTPTITGTAAANTLTGTAGNDVIAGLGGNDSLIGGAGNDVLDGGAGADNMTGGTGNDIYIVDNATDTVVENANEGLDAVQTTLASYTLGANVENLIHTAATAFTGNGNALNNVIVGNTGNDTLNGNAGNDTLFGDAGNDTLNGGDGLDAIYGGVGNDTLNGDAGDDMLSGGDGNDVLIGGAGSDYLNGGAGIDTASYATSTTAIIANLAAPSKNTGDAAGDIFVGIENLIGGSGNDTLTGDANANSLDGGAGDDILIGGAAADALIGGAGIDTASYANATAGVVANLGASAGNTGDAAGDTYTTIENLTGSAFTDTLTGSAGVNVLDGGAGDDILDGGAGNDTLIGGTGNDTLNGGAGADTLVGGGGDDTYVVDNAGDVVTEGLGAGTDLVQTTLGSYTLGDNVENLTFTSAGAHVGTGNALDNVITGNVGADTLSGLAGNDSLIGGAGNDTLDGGLGNDSMVGGLGNDTFVVDSVADVVIENVAEGTDTVQTTLNNYTLGANVENLTFAGAGDFSGTGNDLANTITGGAGNDALDGGAGIDRLVGGAGDDTYRVDNSGDVIVEAAGAGNDTVLATSAAYTLSANVDNLIFVGTGSFNGTGNALANTMVGGAASDTLSGGAGDDTITGGAGNDTMNGGIGNDTFIFAPGFGNDTIVGFDADATGGQDLLALDASLGINAGNFSSQVVITDLGADTQVTIGANSMLLQGVNGVGANSITIDDFRFL